MVITQIKKSGSQKKQKTIANLVRNIAGSSKETRPRASTRRNQYLTVAAAKPLANRDGYLSDSSLLNFDVRKKSYSYRSSTPSQRHVYNDSFKRTENARRSLREKMSSSAQHAYSGLKKMTTKLHTKTHVNCKRRYKKISSLVGDMHSSIFAWGLIC